LYQHHHEGLSQRLDRAEQSLRALTPPPGPGKRQIREEGQLTQRIGKILGDNEVEGLLSATWQKGEQRLLKGKKEEVLPRYEIIEVKRDEEKINKARQRLGWQVQVSNVPVEKLNLAECVEEYGHGCCLERDWNWLKNRPLGLGPLWVSKEEQIEGLVRLLMLALRLLSYIQLRVRDESAHESEPLRGTYAGQSGRKDETPTAARLLQSLSRARISLIGVKEAQTVQWQLINLPPLVERLLRWLGLSAGLYHDLAGANRCRRAPPSDSA
jgi:transposase